MPKQTYSFTFDSLFQYPKQMSRMNELQSMVCAMDYLSCPQQHHFNEDLSRVCLESTCQHHILLCPICEQQLHPNHQTIPYKQLLLQMGTTKTNSNHSILQLANQIKECFSSCVNEIDRLADQFNELILNSKCKIEMYFNSLLDQMTELYQIRYNNNYLHRIQKYTHHRDLPALNKYTQKLKSIHLIYNTSTSHPTQFPMDDFVTIANSKITALNNHAKQLNISSKMNDICKVFEEDIFSSITSQPYKWNQAVKSSKMIIKGLIIVQTGSQSNGQRFATMLPSISKGSVKTTWSLKINKVKGWVGVGICLKNSIQKANYKFNYTTLGHGSYLISANGYSWSDSQLQFNSAFKSFTYTTNDIIQMEYYRPTKTLKFIKLSNGLTFQLKVTDPPPEDQYVPCVNMCSPEDQVEIVSKKA